MLVAIIVLHLPLLWTSSSHRELREPLFSHRSVCPTVKNNCNKHLKRTNTERSYSFTSVPITFTYWNNLTGQTRWVISVKYDFLYTIVHFHIDEKDKAGWGPHLHECMDTYLHMVNGYSVHYFCVICHNTYSKWDNLLVWWAHKSR